MATVAVSFNDPMKSSAPCLGRKPRTELFTSSATSQATTETALSTEVVRVTASGGAVWVEVDPTPTAAEATGYLLLDGHTIDISANAGDKVAIIDA